MDEKLETDYNKYFVQYENSLTPRLIGVVKSLRSSYDLFRSGDYKAAALKLKREEWNLSDILTWLDPRIPKWLEDSEGGGDRAHHRAEYLRRYVTHLRKLRDDCLDGLMPADAEMYTDSRQYGGQAPDNAQRLYPTLKKRNMNQNQRKNKKWNHHLVLRSVRLQLQVVLKWKSSI
jgi:hypothetical protein